LRNRILLLTPYLHTKRGNSLTASRLADGLGAAGIEVEIISLEDDNWQEQTLSALATGECRLLHGLHATSVAEALAALPPLQCLPLLITMTGTDLNYGLKQRHHDATTQVMDQAQRLVVFNEYYLDHLGSWHHEWGKKARVIPQGVELSPLLGISRHQLAIDPANTSFLMVSGLRPVKNIELTLEGLALAYAQDSSLQLLLVGSVINPEYAEYILSRVAKLPWASYLGEFPHSEMASIISQAKVAINSSLSEGQPQAVLEAMCLGLPCLLSAVPGNLGLITEGREGYYFQTAQELADKVLFFMQNENQRRAMGQAAQDLVQLRHHPQQEIDAYLNLYQEILAEFI